MNNETSAAGVSVKNPCVINGSCQRCPFNGDIISEIVCCSLCHDPFHALCRDKRGNYTNTSVFSKSFFEQYQSLSAHYGSNKDRWGQILFICDSCNTKYSNGTDQYFPKISLENNQEIDVDNCILSVKPTSPSVILSAQGTQTLISGNYASGFDSDSECSRASDDVDNSQITNIAVEGGSILNEIKSLLQTNNQILAGIESLKIQTDATSEIFGEQISNIEKVMKEFSQNPITELIDSEKLSKSITDQLNHSAIANSQSVVQKCKPYTDLKTDFLDDAALTNISEFLSNAHGFKTVNTKECNSSRDVLYFGEFAYRYGAVTHEAKELPNEVQQIITKINEKYPTSMINSCLITRYKTGQNVCPSHSDNEPFLAPKSNIFTLSVGCVRKMMFCSTDGTSSAELELPSNSLLSFSRLSQELWKHEIPACPETSVRYSLTFRMLAPYYMNSTVIVGDSNTEHINFGSGRNKLGVWMPGERVKAGRIDNIPSPSELSTPFRNMVIHCGINDLRMPNHLPIPVLAKKLHDKCNSFIAAFPKLKIHLSHILPTKDGGLNAMAGELNQFMDDISKLHQNISVISHANMTDFTGKLNVNLGRHNPDGTTVRHDPVHLGSKGIALLCMNIKSCIIKGKKAVNHGQSPGAEKNVKPQYPYWVPNQDYRPNQKAPIPHNNPWTGDHTWNFNERSSQPFVFDSYHDGFHPMLQRDM